LVAGEDLMAVQKIELLLSSVACVNFTVQNQLCDALKELSVKGRIKIIKEKIGEFEVKDYKLIIAASEDLALNNSIAVIANNNNITVTVVDHQEQCSFLFPSIEDRFPPIIAVTSCGKSPTLSRFIRNKVQHFFRKLIHHWQSCFENSVTNSNRFCWIMMQKIILEKHKRL